MKFDFTQDEAPRESKYLEAGVHRVDVAEWRTASTDNMNDFFEVTFSCLSTGKIHRERWYLSERSLWRLKRDMKAAGIRTLDFDDMTGTNRTLKASNYEIELAPKPASNGRVYHEIKSIRPVAKVAAPVQGPDEEIPF